MIIDWASAPILNLPDAARSALHQLDEGHKRFLNREPRAVAYATDELEVLSHKQTPFAAVIACSDSRTTPEIVFDQPLGTVFSSRVPGNVASDSAKWMIEIAVGDLAVPLLFVLGHIGCLAVKQIVEAKQGAGGALRLDVGMAVHRAKLSGEADVYRQSVIENVKLTCDNLQRESFALQKAMQEGKVGLVGGVYDMTNGEIFMV